jgi:maltose phosphorylase
MAVQPIGIQKIAWSVFIWQPKTNKLCNLLTLQIQSIDKAIENAKDNLGFTNGAALYPMVDNEWRRMNGKLPTKKFTEMAHCFADFQLLRYTGDYLYS